MKLTFKKIVFSSAFLLFFTSITFGQVKIGANPASIGAGSALEIEAANGNKFIVDKNSGQVTIQDGTQGTDKVLFSDADGNTSWKSLSEVKVPVTVFVGNSNTLTEVPGSNNGPVGSRAPLDPAPGYAANWNATAKAWRVPVAGYYRAEFVSRFSTTSAADGAVIMMLRTKLSPSVNEPFTTASPGSKTLTETAYYNAGDLIYAHVWYSSTGTASIYGSNLYITYIP